MDSVSSRLADILRQPLDDLQDVGDFAQVTNPETFSAFQGALNSLDLVDMGLGFLEERLHGFVFGDELHTTSPVIDIGEDPTESPLAFDTLRRTTNRIGSTIMALEALGLATGPATPSRMRRAVIVLKSVKVLIIFWVQQLQDHNIRLRHMDRPLETAEFQVQFTGWIQVLTSQSKACMERYDFFREFLEDLSSRQGLARACEAARASAGSPIPSLEINLPPPPSIPDEPAGQPPEGDCTICSEELSQPTDGPLLPPQLITCEACHQPLHLKCLLAWWLQPVTVVRTRQCPLCRAEASEQIYLQTLLRRRRRLEQLMDIAEGQA